MTLSAILLASPTYAADQYHVLDPGAAYRSKNIAQWTADWWPWTWNSPAAANPLSDASGALASSNNDGPVFFVAGSNFNAAIERTFSVPQDKAMLVPMINDWENCVGNIAISCRTNYVSDPQTTLRTNAENFRNATTSLFVSIDGAPVPSPASHWEVSDVFSGGIAQAGTALTSLHAGAGIDIVGDDISPSLVSGYYVLVTGLSAGTHTIVYGGSTTAFGSFSYQVTAHIDVSPVPEPESYALMPAGLGLVGLAAARNRTRGG
jgi:hypothetical protein